MTAQENKPAPTVELHLTGPLGEQITVNTAPKDLRTLREFAAQGVIQTATDSRVCLGCGKFYKPSGTAWARRQATCSRACLSEWKASPEAFWAKATKKGDCLIWQGRKNQDGYGRVRVGGTTTGAHRHAYALAHGEIPSGLYVCHTCDTPACISPEHLFLGTQQDNMRDMVQKRRQNKPRGRQHGRAKLTEEAIPLIRADRAAGLTLRELAAKYGVSDSAISFIVQGRNWRHA